MASDNFCILRVAKLKTLTNVRGSAKHTLREIKTDNADPERRKLNEDSMKTSAEIVGKLKSEIDAIKKAGQIVKANSVPCVEYFFGASPGAKVWKTEKAEKAFFRSCLHWLQEKHGKDNVVSFHIQRDETTPHAVAYVLPRTKDGRLSAKETMGNSEDFTAMQTSFAARVAKYGLQRGVEGSKSRHNSIKAYYARVNAPEPPFPTPWDALTSGKRQEAVKTLHAQAQEAKAKAKKLQASVKEQARRLKELEAMNKERDGWDALTQKAVARLLKNTYTPADFAKTFGIEIKGKADIFDALVKAGHAQNFAAALVMVATKMPPKGGHGWEELAEFTKALEDAPAVTSQPLAPQVVAKPRGQGFGR
jgi:hypothetical protein